MTTPTFVDTSPKDPALRVLAGIFSYLGGDVEKVLLDSVTITTVGYSTCELAWEQWVPPSGTARFRRTLRIEVPRA